MPLGSSTSTADYGSHQQRCCTECGHIFVAASKASKTCSDKCRKRRSRRQNRQGGAFTEYDVDVSAATSAMNTARDAAIDDLPEVARAVLAEELRPHVREALSGKVLESIGALIDLLPLAHEALRQDLLAYKPVYDPETGAMLRDVNGEPLQEVDGDRRKYATALVLKHTVSQPGLAPQPDAPEAAGITVLFSGMGEPTITSYADELPEERLAELESGESRQCDICNAVKPKGLFVGASSRCEECQEGLKTRINAEVKALEERAR